MALEFKDIGDWTPSTISIVDVPYHPLAYFEVYENDEEFVKKFSESKRDIMANNPDSETNVTMSEGFFERLLNTLVAKRAPEPTQTPQKQTGDDEVTNAQILEKLDKIDARVTAIENNVEPSEPDPEPNNDDDPEGDDANNPEPNNDDNPAPQTVELPLNEDGTLNLDDGVVAKYLPRGTSISQALDVDLQRGNSSGKSLNERTGRNENGMNW
ncbi:hypothetical protein [uncultured Methanobrevibacter sp.]|uniref:hypothetical protein n=1 Tax=uncultured Methanobrevibacter sp. TaxID=253161 RepID=UPI0025DCCC9F|nr:hypothetical protein [uncultured Methanobrevibacter sp.]